MHPVVRKFSLHQSISEEEQAAIELALRHVIDVSAGESVAIDGDPVEDMYVLVEGMLARAKIGPAGNRQLLALMIPGDSCDFGLSLLPRRDHSIVALSNARVARTSDTRLRRMAAVFPNLADAFRRAQLVETSISREWTMNVGSRNAIERAAHFFLETYFRLEAIGLTQSQGCAMVLTQIALGDAWGVSPVHVNRTLQTLRQRKLLAYGGGRLTLLDMPALISIAQFDPTYLHLH